MTKPLEIVLVEDEQLLRELLEKTLSGVPGLVVRETFASAEEALGAIAASPPDVVLSDINLGSGLDGISLAKKLRKLCPDLAIVILSNHADLVYVDALRKALGRHWAYMLKKSALSLEALERCIHSVASGLVVLDPEIVAVAQTRSPTPKLTGRAAEMHAYLAQGYSNASIMKKCALTERTVERLISQVYDDLGIDVENTAVNPRVLATLAFLGELPR